MLALPSAALCHTKDVYGRVAMIALLSHGCADRRTVTVDADVVVAVHLAHDEVSKIETTELTGRFDVEVDRDEELVLVPLFGDDFFEGSPKRPMTADSLRRLAFGFPEAGGAGACGYCTASSVRRPHVLFPGDVCPIAVDRSQDLDGKPVDARTSELVSRSLRVQSPGTCRPSNPRAPDPSTHSFSVILPGKEGEPISAAAANDESVALLSENYAALRMENGELFERREDLPFRGTVGLVIPLPDGEFAVGSRDIQSPLNFRFDRLSRDLSATQMGFGPQPIQVNAHAVLGSEYLLAGQIVAGQNGRGGVARCHLSSFGFRCEIIHSTGVANDFVGITSVGETRFAALSPHEVSIGDLSGEDVLQLPLPEELALQEGQGIGWLAPELFVCTHNLVTGSGTLLATRLDSTPAWRTVPGPAAGCRAFVTLTSSVGLVFLQDGRSFQVSEGAARERPLLPSATVVLEAQANGAGQAIVVTTGHAVFRVDSAGAALLHGVASPDPRVAAIVPDADGFEVISSVHATTRKVTLDGTVSPVTNLPSLPTGAEIAGAVRDGATGELVLAVNRPGGPSLERLGHNAESFSIDGAKQIRAIAEVEPGVLLVSVDHFTLLRITNREVTRVALEWDDPATSEIEVEPELSEGLSSFAGLDQRDGVAFAVGAGATIMRVLPYGPTPHAQRISIPPELQSSDDSEYHRLLELRVVRAFGPGHLVTAAVEQNNHRYDTARILELWTTSTGVRVTEYQHNRPPDRSISSASPTPVSLVGSPSRLVVLMVSGTLAPFSTLMVLGSPDRFLRTPGRVFAAAIHEQSSLILAGDEVGRLYLGAP
ncbi:MAG: hypothetical protein HY791_36575 [Deltaproteobacteria bacterium]|nr:hypothetical protein [Deltaproteobacteria bacterium]